MAVSEKILNRMYGEHIGIVQGNQGYIKRILKLRGCNDATINDVMEKIEKIIEHSGKLGRVIQREKDDVYIQTANAKISKLQSKMREV
jgi:hypothetical protein